MPTILPDNISLEVYNDEFLSRNKGSMPHLLAGSKALLQINPGYKQEAANILMNSIKDEFSSTRTLNVDIMFDFLSYFSTWFKLTFIIYII